ncbi:MAG: hypothetical protein U0270_22555 [Labilithrix sp.]
MSESTECPFTASCELYPRFRLKGALKIWQQRYCAHATQHQRCARYQLSLANEPVPATLLPNGEHIQT